MHLDNAAFRAIKAATPGPYTFILPATAEVPKRLMHPKKRTVGVRIPDHPVVRALLEELGEPLLSSTLLMPGETEPMTDGWQVKEELDHWLDAVIDSGECGSEPTTVVDFSDGAPEVTRVGAGARGSRRSATAVARSRARALTATQSAATAPGAHPLPDREHGEGQQRRPPAGRRAVGEAGDDAWTRPSSASADPAAVDDRHEPDQPEQQQRRQHADAEEVARADRQRRRRCRSARSRCRRGG